MSDNENNSADIPGKPMFCRGCPAEAKTCVTKGHWVPDARVTVVMESPTLFNIGSSRPHFYDANGKLLKKLFKALEVRVGRELPMSVVYAAGASGKPSAETLEHCSELWRSQWSAHYGQQAGTHVIIPLGISAAKSVGLSGKKILDIRGRLQQASIGGRPVFVVPSLSLSALYAKPGLAEVVQQDLLRAVKTAYLDEYVPPKTIEELSKNYVFPKSLEDVKKVCSDIIGYFDPEKQSGPWEWPISVDIETNTLKPFRRDAKILMISFGWDDQKATAILLNHPENKFYDPELAWAEVQKVLECAKPKVFHNAKFDLQFIERLKGMRVHNVVWDTMCGQHWISEDQKGVYGLKALAPTYAPEYEGYEEKLHEALRHGEEVAPTEEDVLKEAKELASMSGEASDTSWLEGADSGFSDDGEEEEDDTPPNNDQWLAEPAWPDGTKEEDKEAYRKARDDWFSFDAAGKGKDRGQASRKWKKMARLLGLPEPTPILMKDLKKALSEWEAVAIDTIMPYAAADADVTRIVFKKQWRRLKLLDMVDDAKRVMGELYLPGARALGALEFRGARVDLDLAAKYDTELTDLIHTQLDRLHGLAMRHFNVNAPKALGEILISLGFKSQGTTKGGQMKTGKDVLLVYQKDMVEALARTDLSELDRTRHTIRLDFVEALLLYKAATKMKSSFLKRLREFSALDGHIHTTFHLTGTSTGRLSSSKLNLQNLPAYMCRILRPNLVDPENPDVIHKGFNVKALLVPEDDTELFWNLDISAAEIRVACYYSGDTALIKAVNDGLDVHTFFLTKIKHPTLEGEALETQYKAYRKAIKEDGDVELDKFRTAVKRVVFGTLYGAGPRKIAAQIGNNFPVEEAEKIIKGLFAAFPGLKKYIEDTKSEINAKSRTSTVFGRYRRFLLAAVNNELRSKAEREGVNFRVQSTSSDLVLSQLCEINDHLHEIEAVMRLTVHDSMAGTIKKHRVWDMKEFFDYWLVQRVKDRFPWLPVPFEYDLEVGPSYGVKQKYKDWVKANPRPELPVAA